MYIYICGGSKLNLNFSIVQETRKVFGLSLFAHKYKHIYILYMFVCEYSDDRDTSIYDVLDYSQHKHAYADIRVE